MTILQESVQGGGKREGRVNTQRPRVDLSVIKQIQENGGKDIQCALMAHKGSETQ